MVCEVIPLSQFRGVLDHVFLDGTGFDHLRMAGWGYRTDTTIAATATKALPDIKRPSFRCDDETRTARENHRPGP